MSHRALTALLILALLTSCFCAPSQCEELPSADLKVLEGIASESAALATEFLSAGIVSRARWAVSV